MNEMPLRDSVLHQGKAYMQFKAVEQNVEKLHYVLNDIYQHENIISFMI